LPDGARRHPSPAPRARRGGPVRHAGRRASGAPAPVRARGTREAPPAACAVPRRRAAHGGARAADCRVAEELPRGPAAPRPAAPPVPVPVGYVTDLAHVIGPDVRARIERLNQELRGKTGAEIAVVTVETTAPLDDFTYAMRIADAWKPGRKGEDTGVVFLVATRDRKLRVLVGYGLEGILPDGLVGEIEDREVVP